MSTAVLREIRKNGIWMEPINPSDVTRLQERFKWCEQQRLFKGIFYSINYQCISLGWWIDHFGRYPMFDILVGGRPAGFVWFTLRQAKSAKINFCAYRWIWGHHNTVPVATRVINRVLLGGFGYPNLPNGFDMVWVSTPVTNKLAEKLIDKIGMAKLGEVPSMTFIWDLQKSVPAIFRYKTKAMALKEDDP